MSNRMITMAALLTGVALCQPQPGAALQDAPQDVSCECRDDGFRMNWFGEGPNGVSFFGLPRARIGISLGGDTRESYDERGAYVRDVEADGPADRAGIRAGDVITEVDGHNLLDPLSGSQERRLDEDGSLPTQRLMALAARWDVGDEVEITYERDGQTFTATMEAEAASFDFDMGEMRGHMGDLGERLRVIAPRLRERAGEDGPLRGHSPAIAFRSFGDGDAFSFGWGRSDLRLSELNPDLGRYFGTETGVLVLDVGEDSDLDLRPGDVILSIGGREVDSPADVHRILRSYEEDESVSVRVIRDGNPLEIEGLAL